MSGGSHSASFLTATGLEGHGRTGRVAVDERRSTGNVDYGPMSSTSCSTAYGGVSLLSPRLRWS